MNFKRSKPYKLFQSNFQLNEMRYMKKLAVIAVAIIATIDLSAQKAFVRPAPVYRPHVVYVRPYGGYGFGYNPWFYGSLGYGYPYYGYPGYYYRHPSKLDRQIINIEQDFSDRIQSVRLDRSLTGKERRQQIRELRHERRQAVYDAKRNYYKQPYNNNYNNNY